MDIRRLIWFACCQHGWIKKPIVIRSKEILESFDSEKDYKATSKNDDFDANDNTNENKFNDLQNMLDRVNLDEVSPKDALDILYAMKKTSKIMEVKQKIIDKEFQTLKKVFLKREKIKIDFLKQNKAINCCKANSKLIDEIIIEI